MDEFFQKLREIQKKERNIGGLARVGADFYKDVSNYLNELMMRVDKNPLSRDIDILREAQRIATEICERREHKIINKAVMNVQRSYQLFEKTVVSDFFDDVPSNSTPEEKKLYLSLVKLLTEHREKMITSLKTSFVEEKPKIQNQKEEQEELGVFDEASENLEQATLITNEENPIRTLIVFEELPSIVGIDKNIYGPIYPQDIITMPEANAMILIKNKKGRFIQKYK